MRRGGRWSDGRNQAGDGLSECPPRTPERGARAVAPELRLATDDPCASDAATASSMSCATARDERLARSMARGGKCSSLARRRASALPDPPGESGRQRGLPACSAATECKPKRCKILSPAGGSATTTSRRRPSRRRAAEASRRKLIDHLDGAVLAQRRPPRRDGRRLPVSPRPPAIEGAVRERSGGAEVSTSRSRLPSKPRGTPIPVRAGETRD